MLITDELDRPLWGKLNKPGARESIRALEEALPDDVKMRWTEHGGIQVFWDRGRKDISPTFCGFSPDRMIYADTPVKQLFGGSNENVARALPLIEAYVKDLAEHSGCQAEKNSSADMEKTRGPTWSLRSGSSPLRFADFDLANFRYWPDCMRRFISAIRQSEEEERNEKVAAHVQTVYWETIEQRSASLSAFKPSATIAAGVIRDLPDSMLEGISQERRQMLRHRAAHLAKCFVEKRQQAGDLTCDECGFNPGTRLIGTTISPRSVMDIHHRNPLYEGVRLTSIEDFDLLCPTCHRIVHALLRTAAKTS